MRLELLVKCPKFCKNVHRETYLSHFINEWRCFLSTFLYKLKNALYEQPQIGTFSKRLYRQWRYISQKFMFSIRNSCLLHRLRIDSKWISSFCLIILPIHTSLSSFNQNMANVKMQDAYYLETILKGTGSVIVIANDQLRNTTSYFLFFLSVAIRWVSKTGYYNFKNSFLILAVLFLLFTAPVFDESK